MTTPEKLRAMPEKPSHKTRKPSWPFKHETTLTPASNGQWRKRHKGRDYYFGPIDDPNGALAEWRARWPGILRGETEAPAPRQIYLTIKAAFEQFINHQLAQHRNGDLTWETVSEYKYLARKAIRAVGEKRDIGQLETRDFDKMLRAVDGLSAISRHKYVIKIKTMLNWISDQFGISIQIPASFKGPPMKAIRKQRNERDDKTLTRKQIQTLLDVADDQAKALILLGINGGFGNADASALRVKDIDLNNAVIDHFRNKTEARRVVPLWPQTVDAIRQVIDPSRELLFVDSVGKPLVRRGKHGICRIMEELRSATSIQATYYGFRYTFATIAAQVADDHARKLIMGHVIDGVSENYVLTFPKRRLLKVSNHVRKWLFKS